MLTATPESSTTGAVEAGVVTGGVALGGRVRRAAQRRVSASSTIAFRVAFGALVAFSSVRFLARGWVNELYLAPDNHLTYPGLTWVVPLPAPLMYAHIAALGVLGVAIAVGYRYRLAAALFAVGFVYVELIDAALYLNHYWFVTLAAVLLAVLPAPERNDLDGPRTVPALTVWALRGQIAVVYVFAGIAKLNPDWLVEAQPLRIWLAARTDRPIIGPLLDEPTVAYLFSWVGAAFDLTIVGWLLWRRTRPFAYVVVVVFHLATAMLFQIGVFPWVMIACTPIFFDPDWPDRIRARLGARPDTVCVGVSGALAPVIPPPTRIVGRAGGVVLVAVVASNLVLPLRHHLSEGDVAFNDDGYYLSWRVMLTERVGFLEFEVIDPATGRRWTVSPEMVLTDWQTAQAVTRPDLALATAHLVVDEFAARGTPGVGIFADSWVAFNGRTRQRWIDPSVDLAAVSRFAPAADYVLPLDPPTTPTGHAEAGNPDREP